MSRVLSLSAASQNREDAVHLYILAGDIVKAVAFFEPSPQAMDRGKVG